ncbi:MAG: adenylate kinase [Thermoanaerobaculia bacterium]
MNVVILGAPGSGKGTQAALLAERFGVPAVSTGDMLRDAVAAGNDLGRRVAAVMASGELVDDAAMHDVVRSRLLRPDAAEGFVLDGYPRTEAQAHDLEKILDATEEPLDAVVLLEVPLAEMVRRALDRGREDDTEAVVRRRQEVFDEQTRPLIRYYRQFGVLRPVDGDQSIQDVFESILQVLPGRG